MIGRRLESVGTARQGLAIEATWHARLRAEDSAATLVTALNRIDGVQGVNLQRIGNEET